MEKQRKRRSSVQIKRLRTLRANKSKDAISADARKAGLASGNHFSSESAKKANELRWARYRAAKAAAEAESKDKE